MRYFESLAFAALVESLAKDYLRNRKPKGRPLSLLLPLPELLRPVLLIILTLTLTLALALTLTLATTLTFSLTLIRNLTSLHSLLMCI